MIKLTRLNHQPLVLNSDLIEHVEVTPDTVITLITGQKLMVMEPAEEVIDRVIAYRRAIFSKPCACSASAPQVQEATSNSGADNSDGG